MTKEAPHPLDVHIGQRLKLRRKMLGLSQVEVGAKVSLVFQQVQKYERGTNSISARRLSQFAEALYVSPMYFYEGYSGEIDEDPSAHLTTQAMHLIQNFCSIPSETVRNSIADFVRELARERKNGIQAEE